MPKTLTEGLDAFLRKLVPLQSEYDKAASHKSSARSCLYNNFKCTYLTETGSFGTGTGIRHYADTDYFAVIPRENLPSNSRTCLRDVKEALQYTFPRTQDIVVNSPAVKVPFGKYTSETMEITPCFASKPIDTKLGKQFRLYQIPDGNGKWMASSPQAHNKYVETINNQIGNNKVKQLIQLVKAWKYYNNVRISSFYIELVVTKYAESKRAINLLNDLYKILTKLLEKDLTDIKDPMGISGFISACATDAQKESALSRLNTAVTRLKKALDAENKGKTEEAFHYLDLLFGCNFPAY